MPLSVALLIHFLFHHTVFFHLSYILLIIISCLRALFVSIHRCYELHLFWKCEKFFSKYAQAMSQFELVKLLTWTPCDWRWFHNQYFIFGAVKHRNIETCTQTELILCVLFEWNYCKSKIVRAVWHISLYFLEIFLNIFDLADYLKVTTYWLSLLTEKDNHYNVYRNGRHGGVWSIFCVKMVN